MVDLKPLALADPFETALLSEVFEELREIFSSGLCATCFTAEDTILSAIQGEQLHPFLFDKETHSYAFLSKRFWSPAKGDFSILSAHGKLILSTEDDERQPHLPNSVLWLLRDEAEAFLNKYRPAHPQDTERSTTPSPTTTKRTFSPTSGKRPRYGQKLINEAVKIIDDLGGPPFVENKTSIAKMIYDETCVPHSWEPDPRTLARCIDKAIKIIDARLAQETANTPAMPTMPTTPNG